MRPLNDSYFYEGEEEGYSLRYDKYRGIISLKNDDYTMLYLYI